VEPVRDPFTGAGVHDHRRTGPSAGVRPRGRRLDGRRQAALPRDRGRRPGKHTGRLPRHDARQNIGKMVVRL
jgi:hypothetical protein